MGSFLPIVSNRSILAEGNRFCPGVGTKRLSVVVKTADGHYIVTPDNGTLTHINESIGIVAVRQIDERVNRLPNSGESYTFHGRDVYVYTAARLAAGVISFEEVGPVCEVEQVVVLPHNQMTKLLGALIF